MAPPRAGTARPRAGTARPPGGLRLARGPQAALGRLRGGLSVPVSAFPPAAVLGQARRGRGTAEGRGGSGEPARSGSAGDLMINPRRRWLGLVSGSSSWPGAAAGSPRPFRAEGGSWFILPEG